jgi:SAM-dependent methyltransferase
MRDYTAEKYKELVEEIDDEKLQAYMQAEQEFIAATPNAKQKTFVDLGAGHGRVEPVLSSVAGNVVAIEINPDMFRGLQANAAALPNVEAVQGDILELPKLLSERQVVNPVFLILQNSLGTIEGDYREVLRAVSDQAKERQGEFILSFLRQQALKGWGEQMYGKLEDMVGKVDEEATDFEAGEFRTNTGYTSKWWRDSDIIEVLNIVDGTVAAESQTDYFRLLRINY